MKESVESSLIFEKHFKVIASLTPSRTGLVIHVVFKNEPLPGRQVTPNVEIWFPINGYMTYMYKTIEENMVVLIESIYDVSDSEPAMHDYFIAPGKSAEAYFYIRIPLEHVERMKEIADKEGIVTLFLHLYFSVLYRARSFAQKTYKLHLVYKFNIPKVIIEQWLARWIVTYAQYIDLPSKISREILSDFIEAVKSFNVGAYKAAVAMARRALQQALEDKGATKGKKLLEQINELKNKKVLDKATASLAHGVRQFGNYGAHPQNDLLAQVTRDDAKLAIDITKKILKELYSIQ